MAENKIMALMSEPLELQKVPMQPAAPAAAAGDVAERKPRQRKVVPR